MIKSRDIHPKRNIYYLGAILLDIIKSEDTQNFDYIVLFEKFCEVEKISINMFILVLDWLFLLGLITCEKNKVKKCF